MKKLIFILLLSSSLAFGQDSEYKFSTIINLEPTPVENQGKTGTCWSFSTTSFLESEVFRLNKKWVDLSEMYAVRKTYPVKAYNYVYRQGKAQFGEGGLSHDVINAVAQHGVVPQVVYTGLPAGKIIGYDHSTLEKSLEKQVKDIVDNPKANLKSDWMHKFQDTLDTYMGKAPDHFVYENQTYTPMEFAKALNIHPEDYVTVTSFIHHPAYAKFILEVPDNFSYGSYYNLPLDEYVQTLTDAIHNGYSVALDSDVSEKTFSGKKGMAIWPLEGEQSDYFKAILPEKWVSPEERQVAFENYSTEDDHLMHITGIVKDQLGNQYYDVKNSWGTKGLQNGGHIFMSIPYFRMKSIAYTVHKDALSPELRKKLGIN